MKPYYDEAGLSIFHGDSLVVLATFTPNRFSTIITDPPYGLGFMGKDWDSPGGTGDFPMRRTNARNTVNTGASRQGGRQRGCEDWAKRQARDMQEFQAWTTEWATAVLRVAKPGAFMLAFGGTRTFHRLTCGIEEAGWEIRDCMNWMYGQGFPKSLDISKAIDKAAGAERAVLAEGKPVKRMIPGADQNRTGSWIKDSGREFVPNVTAPATDAAREWSGWGTALKPSWEPIIVAMKPLDGTFAENAQRHGVAGLHIDGGRIGMTPGDDGRRTRFASEGTGNVESWRTGKRASANGGASGRWPANVIFDEAAAAQLDGIATTSGHGGWPARRGKGGISTNGHSGHEPGERREELGTGASRFFYTAKASKTDRGHGNDHATVKPTALLKYLCKLTATPTGGEILDPFGGSMTTLVAAREFGRPAVAIELEESHCRIGVERLRQGTLFAPESPRA